MRPKPIRFEWDKKKNDRNVVKHGFGFEIAEEFFLSEVLEKVDERKNYGEKRIIAIGQLKGLTITLIYTIRKDIYRIISVRRGRKDEEKRYFEWLKAQTFKD